MNPRTGRPLPSLLPGAVVVCILILLIAWRCAA